MQQEDVLEVLKLRWEILVLLSFVVVSRAATLTGGLAVDESHYARAGLMLYSGNPYFNPTHLPATTGKLLIGLSQLIGTPGTFWSRLPAFLLTLGTIYLSYTFGRILRGRLVGIFAAFLTATFSLFMYRATTALLDGPLAFFLLLSVLSMYLYLETPSQRRLILTTIFILVGILTKIQAFIYFLPPIVFFLFALYHKGRLSELSSSVKQLAAAGGVVGLMSYWPFLLYSPRYIPYERIPSNLPGVDLVFGTPIVRNFAYMIGAAVYVNVIDVSSGQTTEVAGTVYQYPPIWSYEYWLFEHGGVLWFALFLIGVFWGGNRLRHSLSSRDGLLFASTLPPLLLLGFITIQVPKYLTPTLPLIAVAGVVGLDSLLDHIRGRLEFPESVSSLLLIIAVGILVITTIISTPSAIAVTPDSEEFDSSFDQQADYLEKFAAEQSSRPVILLRQPTPVEYYLDEKKPPWLCSQAVAAGGQSRNCPVTTVRPFDYTGEELIEMLENGQVRLAIVKQHPSPTEQRWNQYVRTEGELIRTFEQSGSNSWGVYNVSV